MAVASGTALLIGAGISAAAGAYGAHKASKAQGKATDQAVALQQSQDTEQRRQFDVQEAARKADVERQIKFMQFQWQAAAPLRAARNSVLAKYGINAADQQMPDFSSMVSQGGASGAGIAPGAPAPGTGMPRRSSGGGVPWGALGAGLGAAGAGIASALASRQQPQFGGFGASSAGSIPGQGGVGYAPMSPLPGSINPADLSNWAEWQGYGVPSQEYQGE